MIKIQDGNLYVSYKNNIKYLLKDINIEFKSGETYSIIGVNGSGKSTLLKVLAGKIHLSSGRLLVDNIHFSSKKKSFLRNSGWLNQELSLDDKLSGHEILDIMSRIYGLNKNEFNQSFEFMNSFLYLSDFLDKPVRTLSGGQKRKLDFARAIIHSPKFLFLDEPSNGFDPCYIEKYLQFLNKWKSVNNSTIIAVTHNAKEAVFFDNTVLMSKGKIIQQKKYSQIISEMPHEIVEIETEFTNQILEILDNNFINKNSKDNENTVNRVFYHITDKGIRISVPNSLNFLEFLNSSMDIRKLWSRFSISSSELYDVINYAENF